MCQAQSLNCQSQDFHLPGGCVPGVWILLGEYNKGMGLGDPAEVTWDYVLQDLACHTMCSHWLGDYATQRQIPWGMRQKDRLWRDGLPRYELGDTSATWQWPRYLLLGGLSILNVYEHCNSPPRRVCGPGAGARHHFPNSAERDHQKPKEVSRKKSARPQSIIHPLGSLKTDNWRFFHEFGTKSFGSQHWLSC